MGWWTVDCFATPASAGAVVRVRAAAHAALMAGNTSARAVAGMASEQRLIAETAEAVAALTCTALVDLGGWLAVGDMCTSWFRVVVVFGFLE